MAMAGNLKERLRALEAERERQDEEWQRALRAMALLKGPLPAAPCELLPELDAVANAVRPRASSPPGFRA
jgi:hypothetical protein